MTKMAAQFIHLLCISCTVCMIVCSLAGINFDVPDGVVYTDLHRTARKGDELVLKCHFYGTPWAVYWKKGEDPYNSPDLITRVDGGPSSGSCIIDQSCSMDEDYSLIINHISIANQGRHICLVSNYLGILIHNFTDLTVYAPPMEPFPVIKECPVKRSNDTEQTCSLSTSDKVIITCSASGYFPDINLFFLQGDQQMDTTNSEEAINPDGTKNKSISIVAEPSDTPYVCIAYDIPGSQDQRTVSTEVNSGDTIVNTMPNNTSVPVRGVAKVVVPAVVIPLVVLLCVAAFCCCWRETPETNNDPEAMPLNADPKTAGSFGTRQHQPKEGDILERPHPDAKYFNFSSIFDDDLRMLLKHLPSDAKQLFMEKIGSSVEEEGDDNLEEKLREWRDKNLRKSSLQDLVAIHTRVLKMKNGSNVLDVTDDELEKVMESITSPKQVEKLTSMLGINNTEGKSPLQHLIEWRDSQKTEKPRKTLRKTLHAMNLSGCLVDPLSPKYVYEAEMVRIALTMLATDVEPLATLLKMDTNKVKTAKGPEKGTVGLLMRLFEELECIESERRSHFSITLGKIGYPDVARSAFFGYGATLSELFSITSRLSEEEMEKLISRLELDGTVQSGGKEARSPCNSLELMKMWKNQLKREPVHFRFKLAMGIRAIEKVELAEDVLAGRFRPREISSDVVESICSSLDNTQLEKLCEHIEPNKRRGEDDQSTTLVADWVNSWLRRFEEFTPKQLIKDKLGSRVQENDGLFKAGFFELAEETMLLGVSRLISVKPVNQEFDEISNEGEVEANPESTVSVETPSGEQSRSQVDLSKIRLW